MKYDILKIGPNRTITDKVKLDKVNIGILSYFRHLFESPFKFIPEVQNLISI